MFDYKDQHVGTWMQPGNFFGVPVDYEAKDMNPWRKSILQILLGIALYTISIDYLLLNLIMPVAGVILMYLGMRTLREENKWFGLGNLLVGLEGIWVLADIFLTGTVLNVVFHRSVWYTLGYWATRVLQIGTLLCLRQGMQSILIKAGRVPRMKDATLLMGLYAAAVLLGIFEGNTLLSYALIGVYALILWTLYRLSRLLDRAGYVLLSTPVALSDTVLTGLFVGLAAVAVLAGSVVMSQYPMRWTPHRVSDEQKYQQIIRDLSTEALIGEALEELTEEDLLACEGGTVEICTHDKYRSPSASNEITVVSLYIRLPGTENRWKVIHRFHRTMLLTNRSHMGTESLIVQLGGLADKADAFSGQVLYYAEAGFLRADLADLSVQTYLDKTTGKPVTSLCAGFSFPKKANRSRGYVSYEVTLAPGEDLRDYPVGEQTTIYYIYQHEDEFQYPNLPAYVYEMTVGEYGSYSGAPFTRLEKVSDR